MSTMSNREHIAAVICAGLAASEAEDFNYGVNLVPRAVKLADALLAELARTEPTTGDAQ